MSRTWTYTVLLLLAAPALLFGQFDPLAEGGDAQVVFERALASQSREEWEVLLGLGLDAGGFSGNDALAIGQALLVQWLTERWAAEVGAPDRQALVDAIAAANTQYLFVYDSTTATYQQDSVGDYLLQDSTGYLEPGGEREAWLAQVETAGDTALEAWRAQTQATYLELLAAEGIEQSSGIGQAFAASIAQYQAAAEREFTALIVRQERQLSYLRLQDTLSARREGEAQSAATVTDELVGATQVGLAEVTQALAAAVPNADDPAGDLNIDPDQWQESFRRQFEAGLAAWGEAEDRFVAERLAWETDAQQAYATAEGEWDQAFIEFGTAREAWFTQMNQILAAGQNAWGQQLAEFAADVQDELASLAAAQAEEQATRAAEAQAYLAAYEQASGVLAMADQNIAYLEEREAGLVAVIEPIDAAIAATNAQLASLPQQIADMEQRGQLGGIGFSNPGLRAYFRRLWQQELNRLRSTLRAQETRLVQLQTDRVRPADELALVRDELGQWNAMKTQFGTLQTDARASVLDFAATLESGMAGTSSAQQEIARLDHLIGLLEDEVSIAQAVFAYAGDTTSDRATVAETEQELAAATAALAGAERAYQDLVAELEAIAAGDLASAQGQLQALETELTTAHAVLSNAKQELQNAVTAGRLQDANVFENLITQYTERAGQFLAPPEPPDPDAPVQDYLGLLAAWVGDEWELEVALTWQDTQGLAEDLLNGDEAEGLVSYADLSDRHARLEALNLGSVAIDASAAEFNIYLQSAGIDATDPAFARLAHAWSGVVTAYEASGSAEDPTVRLAMHALGQVHDALVADAAATADAREYLLALAEGRVGGSFTIHDTVAEPIVLSADEVQGLEAAAAQAVLATQVAELSALVSGQLAVNSALTVAANVEADWIAGLQAAATAAIGEAERATAASATAAVAASDTAAAVVAAEQALAAAEIGGDPDEIAAAQEVLDQAILDAGQAATAAEAAEATAIQASELAEAAIAELAAATDTSWPDSALVAELEAAFDTANPAQQLAIQLYLSGQRSLAAEHIASLTAAQALLAGVDTSDQTALTEALDSAELTAAGELAGQFVRDETNLLDALAADQSAARKLAQSRYEQLATYGSFTAAYWQVATTERAQAVGAAIETFTTAVDDPAAGADEVTEAIVTAYRALGEADPTVAVSQVFGMYARTLVATGRAVALDQAAIDALSDPQAVTAHTWLRALAADPAGAALTDIAKTDAIPDGLDPALYRTMLDLAALAVFPPGLTADGEFATIRDAGRDLVAERSEVSNAQQAFVHAEAGYRDALVQRIGVQEQLTAFESSNAGYLSVVEDLHAQVAAAQSVVDQRETDLSAALVEFQAAAERYAAKTTEVDAAATEYESARLRLRTTEAVADYARSGAVEGAPDPADRLAEVTGELERTTAARELVAGLSDTQVSDAGRDAEYAALVQTEQEQLQAIMELSAAAEAVAGDLGQKQANLAAAHSDIMAAASSYATGDVALDFNFTDDFTNLGAAHLNARVDQFTDADAYFTAGEAFNEYYTRDLVSFLAEVDARGSGYLRGLGLALYYDVTTSGDPAFRDPDGSLENWLVETAIDGRIAGDLKNEMDTWNHRRYSSAIHRQGVLDAARGHYHQHRSSGAYRFYRMLVSRDDHSMLTNFVLNDINGLSAQILDQRANRFRDGLSKFWRRGKRKRIKNLLRELRHPTGAPQRSAHTKRVSGMSDAVADWNSAYTAIAALTDTEPTQESVEAAIRQTGAAVTAEVSAAVASLLAHGTTSQTASIASVISFAAQEVQQRLAVTGGQIRTRVAQLATAQNNHQTTYLQALGSYRAGTISADQFDAAVAARFSDPAYDAVDHHSTRIAAARDARAAGSTTIAGETAVLQAVVQAALGAATHSDRAHADQVAGRYAAEQEALQRSIDRWGQATGSLLVQATAEWNRSYTRLEGQRLRWRQETEERYAHHAQLWDLRHAQLVASRDAWLENATRQAMVASSEAIAVQWDLEATALIADAESAIIPSFGVDTPDLAALVDQATASSTLEALIARAGTLQSRARDTNVVVAAYLPTVNTQAAQARVANTLSADLFDRVTERAATLAAIQAREQFGQQLEAVEDGVADANDNVAVNLETQMLGAGYRRQGGTWQRRSIIDSSLFGGNEYETQTVAAYRAYTAPRFTPQVDLSQENLTGLSGEAIFTLVERAQDEMMRYQVLIFGRSENQKDESHEDYIQAASAEEFNDTLGAILDSAETSWRRGAGYRRGDNKTTEGLFSFHVGYAPQMDEEDPERIKERGYGQMGTIMGQFMINEARWSRGYAAMGAPIYRKPLWDSDGNNDGSPDGLFGAPSIAGVYDIGFAIAATVAGTAAQVFGPVAAAAVSTAVTMIDDAVFTALDVGTGYADGDDAWAAFGKKAAATAVTNAVTLGFGSLANVGTSAVSQAVMAGVQYSVSTAATTAVNSIQWEGQGFFGGMDFDQRGFQETMTSTETLTGLAAAMIGGAAAGGTDGMNPGQMQATKRMGNLIGNVAQAGMEYAFLGETTLNVLNANMFGEGNINQGLLEFNIGGNTSTLNLGSGGIDVSYGTVSQALAGREIWWENQRNTYHGVFGGNVTYAEGYRGVRRTGAMLRSAMSYGNEAAQARREAILSGEIDDVVIGAIDHGGQTITENGRTIMHIGTLGERGRDGLFSRMAAGLVLQHEAYRDGTETAGSGQTHELLAAVTAHTMMAQRIEADYEGFLESSGALSTQSDLLQQATESGDMRGFIEHVLSTYDNSADNWRMVEGGLQATDSGFLQNEEGLYVSKDRTLTLKPTEQTIGAEDAQTGLQEILGLTADEAARMMRDQGVSPETGGTLTFGGNSALDRRSTEVLASLGFMLSAAGNPDMIGATGVGPVPGEPYGAFLGRQVHQAIGENYRFMNLGNLVFTNNTSLASIANQLGAIDGGLGLAAGHLLNLQPDILDAGPAGALNPLAAQMHNYEIKPLNNVVGAQIESTAKRAVLNSLGLNVLPGPMEQLGASGVVPSPNGVAAYFSPQPGVILYRNFRDRQVPANDVSLVFQAQREFDQANTMLFGLGDRMRYTYREPVFNETFSAYQYEVTFDPVWGDTTSSVVAAYDHSGFYTPVVPVVPSFAPGVALPMLPTFQPLVPAFGF